MKRRVVVVLLFAFVLMFSIIGNVSAASTEDEPGFFGKIGGWFKWLFMGDPDVDVINDDDDDDYYDDDSNNYSTDDDNNNFVEFVDIQVTLNGPVAVGVNEPATFTGSVTGTSVCTLHGTARSDCSSFTESFSFSLPGTYSITLAAGDKTETIDLVVEAEAGNPSVNITANNSIEPNASVQITLIGPASAEIGETITYTGSVTGTDACSFFGTDRTDCALFSAPLMFGAAGTQYVTLSAGGNMETIVLTVEPDTTPITPITPITPVTDGHDTTTNINAKPIDDGNKENGWPTYLNVPDFCPAPTQGEVYTYFMPRYNWQTAGVPTVGPVQLGAPGAVQGYMLRGEYSGANYAFVMGKQETYALPFYSGNFGEWALRGHSGISTGSGMLELALSECPGDFNNVADIPGDCARGPIGWSDHYGFTTDENSVRRDYDCSVEPGKRYFLNARMEDKLRGSCQDKAENAVCDTVGKIRVSNRNAYGKSGFLAMSYPPYIGPCLSSPPFPPNYDIKACQRGTKSDFPEGRCHSQVNWDEGVPQGSTREITCTDGVGGAFLAEFEFTCQNNEWTVTSDAIATPNMACNSVTRLPSDPAGCIISRNSPSYETFDVKAEGTVAHYASVYRYSKLVEPVRYIEATCTNNKWILDAPIMLGFDNVEYAQYLFPKPGGVAGETSKLTFD
jgi:hypothetical protein